MLNWKTLIAAVFVTAGTTGIAAAATCTFNNSKVELSPTTANTSCGLQPNYSDVGGVVDRTFFDETYRLSYKSDEAKGDGAVQISNGLADEDTSDTSWEIGNFASFVSVLIGIKQGSGYALFELAAASGDWGVFNAKNGNRTNDISHWDVWYRGQATTPPPSSIPLPAGGVLLLTALGGLALARRRKA